MSFDLFKYQDILSTLNTWGAVYQKDLYELSGAAKSESTFKRNVANLVSKKIIKKINGGYNSMESIYFGNKELITKHIPDFNVDVCEYKAAHDALCSRVIKYLLDNNLIYEFCFEHDFKYLDEFNFLDNDFIRPDAIINTIDPKETVFIEMEIVLKNKFRIAKKLKLIASNSDIPRVIYICTTKMVYNSLSRDIRELGNTCKGDFGKISVLYLPSWRNRVDLFASAVSFDLKNRKVLGV